MTEVRTYKNSGTKYTPVPLEERKYKINKPDHPEAIRIGHKWFVPFDVLPDDERVMPETRPDDDTLRHRALCRCDVCRRPGATRLWHIQQRRIVSGKKPRRLT